MVYEDNRNWPEYNGELVKRGWFYLSADFLDYWDDELKVMNKGKNGRPYIYPNSFIQYCALIYAFLHLPYRQLQGYLQALSMFVPGLRSANYTTLWERIWTAPLRVDNELSDAAQLRGAHEEDKTALRPGVQDINSG